MSGGNSLVTEMTGGNSRVYGAFPLPNVCETATRSKTNEKPPIIRGRCGGNSLVPEMTGGNSLVPEMTGGNSLVSEMGGGNPLVYGAFSSPKRMRNRHSFENE